MSDDNLFLTKRFALPIGGEMLQHLPAEKKRKIAI